ncbi:tRNA(fMet)-specific endonuclease VapC [Nitrospirillum amazonense]|uniref:Ribonuclease VapC n=1 Tax=Nitrospirillum amazonense TaxID=28077 RepID=A0A560KH72_9PROT|nr:type II toxin-antitoxin system VapC family toxin [Nitrospirillum amazonense]TWB82429.1 tRNA(fMet)-specific endonuclease VapC [Nitrospirillum amazonense]
MKFLLDTNAVIAVMKGEPTFLNRMRQYQPEDFGLSTIVAYELYFGATKSQRRLENTARVDALRFPILDFDREDARETGVIRAHLATAGMPIGPYDVLIAGQALARNLTLVTHNTREFPRVPRLQLEDWR